jgi:LemA protein
LQKNYGILKLSFKRKIKLLRRKEMNVIGIIIVVIIIIVLWMIRCYNSLVNLRNKVEEAFSTMDVYLKKRFDLIPNLVEIVKGYAKYESSTLENMVKLRGQAYNSMSTEEKVEANNKLSGEISKLLAIAENYPDLKANENFRDLTAQLASVENDIANARKYYNAVVKGMNNKVQMFPSNIVANMFKFKTYSMFEANEAERENVKVQF